MEIRAEITGIEYKVKCAEELKRIDINYFDINTIPSFCLITDKKKSFAVSKWVSPKRTRSYPFERVYNTLNITKKITVIPVVKDEGAEGDRDFIQWDTISLMSLLDVYVIIAYYNKAEKHRSRKNKITKQQFDNKFVLSKIQEISNYHSSALHWNLKELNDNLTDLVDKAKGSYSGISKKLKINFHNSRGLDDFKSHLLKDVNDFMDFSRCKANKAANREQMTIQPKEILKTDSKATITIKNYLGGIYYLTTDEIKIEKNTLFLIESKHSKSSLLPSKSDIKDGLLKLILYCNLSNVTIANKTYKSMPVLNLTSAKIKSSFNLFESKKHKEEFFEINKFSEKQRLLLGKLFEEAKLNKFIVIIQNG